MVFGLIIIGDEILSGKRADKHFSKIVELLSARDLQLGWAEIIGDDPQRITATLKRTIATNDIVFCCGGIGATPDDHTRQCAAAAFGVSLELHPQAKMLIEQRMAQTAAQTAQQTGNPIEFNTPDYVNRLKMGEFPKGSQIIPNTYNLIPGFFMANHYFVPGFPVMVEPMVTWILDTHYTHLFYQNKFAEKSALVFEVAESTLTPLMERLEIEFPLIKIFSLPSVGNDSIRRHIELGVKGSPTQVEQAFAALQAALHQCQMEYVLV